MRDLEGLAAAWSLTLSMKMVLTPVAPAHGLHVPIVGDLTV